MRLKKAQGKAESNDWLGLNLSESSQLIIVLVLLRKKLLTCKKKY
jgi:hypothetical protein